MNVIILNADDNGSFIKGVSTYEIVSNSYFDSPKPNALLIEKFQPEETVLISQTHWVEPIQFKEVSYGDLISSRRNRIKKEKTFFSKPKQSRNSLCACGSRKKFKNCCSL